MQALYTHFDRPPSLQTAGSFNVHGSNALFQNDSSFEQLLKKEVFTQEAKAMEGPPENRNFAYTAQGAGSAEDVNGSAVSKERERQMQQEQSAQNAHAAEKTEHSEAHESVDAQNGCEKDSCAGKSEAAGKNEHAHEQAQKESADGAQNEKSGADALLAQVLAADGFGAAGSANEMYGSDEYDAVSKAATAKLSDSAHADTDAVDTQNALFADASMLNGAYGETNGAVQKKSEKNGKLERVSAKDKHKENASLKETASEHKDFSAQNAKRRSDHSAARLSELPSISVRDERTKTVKSEDGKKANAPLFSSVQYDGKGNVQSDVFFDTGSALSAQAKSTGEKMQTERSQFASLLSDRIKNSADDFVKAGSIILRDGNRGSINLILHPEELGNVKIRLQISDNILTGRITVASEEAYNAFKANIVSLNEAFASNGFDTAGFDLSWSGQNEGQHDGGNGTADKRFALRYEEENPFVVSDEGEKTAEYSLYSRAYVNVMA
jgi:flagellar hook-length control protein fliK